MFLMDEIVDGFFRGGRKEGGKWVMPRKGVVYSGDSHSLTL